MDTASRDEHLADVSVRPARPGDAAAVAEVQVETWRAGCDGILPPEAVEAIDVTDAETRWRDAVLAPPTPGHVLLVAIETGRLVGFTAVGPGADEDAGAATGEIFELLVEPGVQRTGHGSRLLAAAIDHFAAAGLTRAVTWRFADDEPGRSFLSSAGWSVDGSRRALDVGTPVEQVRWHTDLGVSVTVVD